MKNKLVSIIVAAYNAEETIDDTFSSIASQTYPNYEVIIIDDGSTDSTGAICDRWASSDSRFRVFHRRNKGSAAARNFGMTVAQGEYLQFVDSDDIVDSRFVEIMLNAAVTKKAQIVFCNHTDEYFSNKTSASRIAYAPNGIYFYSESSQDFRKKALVLMNNGYWHTAWNKMYNTEFVKRIGSMFNESISVSEDTFFITPLYEHADCVVCLKDSLYRYRIRGNSLSHSFTPSLFADIKKAFLYEETESISWPSDCSCFFRSDFLHYIEFFFTPFYIKDTNPTTLQKQIVSDEIVQKVAKLSRRGKGVRNRMFSSMLLKENVFLLKIYGSLIFILRRMIKCVKRF